jgi:hypothetical protein
MTEHRCVEGVWRPGKIKDCGACSVRPGKGRPAKRMGET